MIPPLEMQHSEDQGTQLSRENVKAFVKKLEDNPMLDGVLLEDIEFSAAVTVETAHTLGRNPRGWVVTDDHSGAFSIVKRTAGDWNDKFLSLVSNGACTISVWVF